MSSGKWRPFCPGLNVLKIKLTKLLPHLPGANDLKIGRQDRNPNNGRQSDIPYQFGNIVVVWVGYKSING